MQSTNSQGLIFYKFAALLGQFPLLHFVTTRNGGSSEWPYDSLNMGLHVGDRSDSVIANRKSVCAAMGIEIGHLVTCNQVHAGNVTRVTREMRGMGSLDHSTAVQATDAFVTNESGICCAVMLADCVPVVIYDPVHHALGVAHSGWKGTVLGVTTNTVKEMASQFGSRPEDLVAGVGPSIGPDRYEVGPEVVDQARAAFPNAQVIEQMENGKGLFDLWEANRHQLLSLGLRPDNVEVAELCTFDNSDVFFSDRKQRPTGRFMTAAMLLPQS